jgi:uncharacterized protein (TIGR02145 family)
MKKNKRFIFGVFLFFFINFINTGNAQSIKASNIHYRIIEDKIEIFYDLPVNHDSLEISVAFLKKTDPKFRYYPRLVTGDVRRGMFSGENRKITWYFKKEPAYIFTGGGFSFEIQIGIKDEKPADDETNTEEFSTIKDIDNNEYRLETIGTQVWMIDNLRTTRLNNGNKIPYEPDTIAWSNLEAPGYCYIAGDCKECTKMFGVLYNWYVVKSGHLCPTDWHVPSDDEWTILSDYLGGDSIAGGTLKTTGTFDDETGFWMAPNTDATNASNFSAMPAGFRSSSGSSKYMGYYSAWWSKTGSGDVDAWYRLVYFHDGMFKRGLGNISRGLSVRCVKD